MTTLPIATNATVRRHARRLLNRFRRPALVMLAYYGAASAAALAAPFIIGQFVQRASVGSLTSRAVLWLVVALLVSSLSNTALNYIARRQSYTLGERCS